VKRRKAWRAAAAIGAVLLGAVVGGPLLGVPPAAASTIPTATVVGTPSVFDSNAEKTATAQCAAGQKVIGGGVRVNVPDHVVVVRQEPISTPAGDSFVVTALEDEVGTTNSWALQAYAVCTNPIAGLQIMSVVSPTGSSGFQGISSVCPAGKNAVGAGGRILDGQGQVSLVTQIEGGFMFNVRTTAGGLEDPNGFAGNWSVISFTVCVPLALSSDLQVVKTFVTASDLNTGGVANSRAGMAATGGTGWANLPSAVASVNIDANRTRVQLVNRLTNSAATWSANVMAFCVS
jgi:hypothetical protein